MRRFVVRGLDCSEEVEALRRTVGPLVGGAERLVFDLMAGEMRVDVPRAVVDDEAIIAAVRKAGLTAAPAGSPGAPEASWWARRGRLAMTVASGVLLVVGSTVRGVLSGSVLAALGLGHGAGLPLVVQLLYLAATVCGAWFVLPRAVAAVRALRPDMNLLMTVAVTGAILIGQWMEAATVAFLFAVSLLLESWSVGRARRAIERLMALAPPVARRRAPDGTEAEVSPEAIAVGETVVVYAGERIPLDGEVSEGCSSVDTSPVTGESEPRLVEQGATVYAGTIALDGTLAVKVTHPASDTVLARIVRRVAEAGRRRARSEQWVDRFARVYTPVVFAVAILTAVLPPVLGLGTWQVWIYRALVLLVIGCPCALVISTPVAVVAGLAAAARRGVLVKGGDLLEVPAKLVTVAFDKTGTLTTGEPRVVEVVPGDGHTKAETLATAAALELRSAHPLGAAIVAAARERGVDPLPAEGVRTLAGRGIVGSIEERPAWLGSHRLFEERGQETPELHERVAGLARAGRTVVVVGRDDHVCGFIALSDATRPQARGAVAGLRALGIRNLVMLTGDNPETADEVAAEVGIDDVRAGLLPEDKMNHLADLRQKGPLAFVGDGVNDAPALAMADLGIAMGAGTDVALETAHAALMAGDLSRIPWLVSHSRRTLRIIRTNIGFALGIKVVFVVLTFLGHASLWAAIAADTGASLLVTFNSLRLLRTPEPEGPRP
ncbi:MAG: cation-translocating P-type ATPase [Acidobacteria bacterium]|nr:cation-translocating P-type ATPase [Acidobacteriota bacterium]